MHIPSFQNFTRFLSASTGKAEYYTQKSCMLITDTSLQPSDQQVHVLAIHFSLLLVASVKKVKDQQRQE